MLDVLLRPTQFFQSLAQRKPNLAMPSGVVIVSACLATVANVLLVRLLPNQIPGLPLQIVLALVSGLVIGLVFWGLGGALVRFLAGANSRAWEIFGWASAPGIVAILVFFPLASLWPITGNLAPLPSSTDLAVLQAWQKAYTQLVNAATQTRIYDSLNILSTLWFIWILLSGLRVTAPNKAVLATAVVGIISLGLTIVGWVS
jgi:hypothetical protein